MKIVILDGYTLNPGDLSWQPLEEFGEVEIYDQTNEADILKRSEGADILLTNKTPLNREIIESLENLKYIGILATGFNVVDLKAAAENEIVVTNAPGYSTDSVAQFTFALILEAAHHVGEHNRAVKEKEWSRSDYFCFWNYPLIELKAKRLGIIGFGSIGQKTAELAQAFGMEVLAHDRSPQKKIADPEISTENIKFLSLNELYQSSDIITLHCPLTDSNSKMINKKSISKMKDGVIIVNTARGGLIDEKDLAVALKSGKVQTAAVDVLSSEPPETSNPLLNSANTIITPHIAWAAKEARENLMEIVVENIRCFMADDPINKVN